MAEQIRRVPNSNATGTRSINENENLTLSVNVINQNVNPNCLVKSKNVSHPTIQSLDETNQNYSTNTQVGTNQQNVISNTAAANQKGKNFQNDEKPCCVLWKNDNGDVIESDKQTTACRSSKQARHVIHEDNAQVIYYSVNHDKVNQSSKFILHNNLLIGLNTYNVFMGSSL